MTLEALVANHLKEYPTLYGNSRTAVLDQLFLTNGNGLKWTDDGELTEACGPSHKEEKQPSRQQIHKETFARLAKIPAVSEARVRVVEDNHRLAWAFPKENKGDEDLWIAYQRQGEEELLDNRQSSIESACYLDKLSRPHHFNLSSSRAWSLAAHTPKNVRPDYAQGVADALKAAIQGISSDYAPNSGLYALTLLLRLTPLLQSRGVEISPKEILSLREEAETRRLALDVKRHVNNHAIDNVRLANLEFFELHQLCPDGLSEKERSLIRRYVQYKSWLKDFEDKRTEAHKKTSRALSEAIWLNATITKKTLRARLTQETIGYAQGKIAEAQMWARIKKG